ncbi:MAG: peptidase prolyl oligopeptidase active site domain protein [Bryobacterales bacterium]|nr:peptidase prolyl oligopeptidase active site domain protein [Bryobacterales bacterium]
MIRLLAIFFLAAVCSSVMAQQGPTGSSDVVLKAVDDVMWHLELGDIADVDKFSYTGPPPARERNSTAQGAGNPMILYGYTLIPKKLDRAKKQPLIVFVHEGVHSNFMTGGRANCAHVVRELIEQGYSVVAPEYRGSTGYGTGYSQAIDYGGHEVDDVFAAREWVLERYSFLDPKRVGIIGWSHGGFITLMNIFQHPGAYVCAYTGVPVSDLVARMGYKNDGYRKIYSDMLGKDANDNVKEYIKRSPYAHAAELSTPLLIHGNSNDEDVNVLEVKHMIDSLKAEGKKFEYKIYEDAPGGHYFNRLDTALARESRAEVWAYLRKYLQP